MAVIQAIIRSSAGWEKELRLPDTENGFWKGIGELILDATTTETLEVETPLGWATLPLMKRGTRAVGTERVPAMHIDQKKAWNDIRLPRERYEELELRCINPEGNNYKKYYFEPNGAQFYGRYGSIDVPKSECKVVQEPYESWLYWPLYYTKLTKGYVDVTAITGAGLKDVPVRGKAAVGEAPTQNVNTILYRQLMAFARNMVRETLSCVDVTQKQASECRRIFRELSKRKTVKGFNSQLKKLMLLSPRKRNPFKGDSVMQYMAQTEGDFQRIIDFEESLLLAMEAVAGGNVVPAKKSEYEDNFRKFGIHVWEATAEQKDEVIRHLGDNLKYKVKKVYRVKSDSQEKRFYRYLSSQNIQTVKMFWHGSVNANWASIIQNSLKMSVRAANGRMFGDGIYFAPSAAKSWGYTSGYGSRWANGNSGTAFMGLFATAYGDPYHPTTHGYQTEQTMKRLGKNCVHAEKASCGLLNDEVIFYDESAVCLKYLVEFAA